jgi:plastocyanin
MKQLFILLAAFAITTGRSPATTHVITASGVTFSPSSLNVASGDTIDFAIGGSHDAVEVAQSDWIAEADVPLPGGFAVPFGGGMIVLNDTGTYYYICQAHIVSGMKGTITVGPPPPPTTTMVVTSIADRDGLVGTTSDRVARNWSLTLYQDSVGSGIILGSVSSATTLSVAGLPAGTYAAAEADSASWSHVSVIVDGVTQPPTSQNSWTMTVGAGGTHTIDFLQTAPNMIISSGLAFDPDTLTVDAGDTVFFVLAPGHAPREVSKSTWLTGGTASNGGFDLPSGGGYYVAVAGGVDYYVCVAHAGSGGKGLVFVNPVPPSTITLTSRADRDGNHVTTTDRIAKPWSMKLFKDSVGSGIVVDSTLSDTLLTVTGLPPGVYVAAEADSAPWTHLSQIVDGVSQGALSQATRSFSVGSGESRSVEFLNTVPNMIISSGLAFVPETLAVDSGETVWFVLGPAHNARSVDSTVWLAGDTVSNGGFDLPFGGGYVVMNQPGTNFYVCVPDAAGGMKGIVNVFVAPSEGSLTDSVSRGWNLLSAPFVTNDTLVTGLYPGATSQAFVYGGGYSRVASVSNGPGYWLKFSGAQEVSYSGLLVASDTVPVAQAWNIVGSVSAPVPVASISSIPGGLVTTPFYRYDSGLYFVADTILPGNGYWVKVSAPGSLLIGPSAGAAPTAGRITIVPGGELPPDPPVLTSDPGTTPTEFGLVRSYPNPFNPSTRISYVLDRETRVKVAVYNLAGETVTTLVDRVEGPGAKVVEFDGTGLAGGVYIVRVSAGTDAGAVKVVLVK